MVEVFSGPGDLVDGVLFDEVEDEGVEEGFEFEDVPGGGEGGVDFDEGGLGEG